MLAEGIIWAALGAVFFPAGYSLGRRLSGPVRGFKAARARAYYGALAAVAAAAWIASAVAIAAGL
jgi:hypothetical protein